ncbi:hypothetical protein [Noviluteimonas gilva]|uniref:TonB C-terminal domain-containing protein n=1 Tax=Noviluteimonas gilva TaxID=2682097 RepID=A0A7C9MNN8_9GAMM|nr:hypothetical protein [Lysobacter gilvus]MUV15467.1 hypothetical protein [Lysobacter gilvus]
MLDRSMRRTAPLLTALVIALASPAGNAKRDEAPPPPLEEVMTMRVEGTITIDATGHVVAYEIATKKLPDAVRIRLEKAIGGWSFEPVAMPEGKTTGTTSMDLMIAAIKVPEGHLLRLEDAAFGEGLDARESHVATRTYLQSPYRSTNAIVRVAARVDAEGRAEDTGSLRCTLFNAGGDAEEKALICRRLENLSVEAVRVAKFREFNMTLPGTAEVRVMFEPEGPIDERPGKWRIESRTAQREIAWHAAMRAAQPAPKIALREGIVGASL